MPEPTKPEKPSDALVRARAKYEEGHRQVSFRVKPAEHAAIARAAGTGVTPAEYSRSLVLRELKLPG